MTKKLKKKKIRDLSRLLCLSQLIDVHLSQSSYSKQPVKAQDAQSIQQ